MKRPEGSDYREIKSCRIPSSQLCGGGVKSGSASLLPSLSLLSVLLAGLSKRARSPSPNLSLGVHYRSLWLMLHRYSG